MYMLFYAYSVKNVDKLNISRRFPCIVIIAYYFFRVLINQLQSSKDHLYLWQSRINYFVTR